ncbi:MAG: putative peptidoglycan-binding protein [Bacillota bacterium]|jgi:peptidoglycan hydrolase-like protein with peptidoglycan-binding domain|nr:putative peptidoglycan-binding protein [Bacillota bacterium]
MSITVPGFTNVYVPENITVHLGPPDDLSAENVTLPYIDYIKNVASSELYPTWPESTIRANIYAINSITLNRLFTEWYKTKGYNFDITNSTQYDQSFVQGRGTFSTIDKIVDELFNDYIVTQGEIVPLFTTYCDGRTSQCEGMYQWGTVDLANQGYLPIEILQYYYGENINIVTDAPVAGFTESYPGTPLKVGDSGILVLIMQIALNGISVNFPAIPKINPINGIFTANMEESVKEFQRIFNLAPDGTLNKATWYKILNINAAVRKLAELSAKGSIVSTLPGIITPEIEKTIVLPSIQIQQYFINVLSTYYNTIPSVEITGVPNPETRTAIMEFQKVMKLPVTGILNTETWNLMYKGAMEILKDVPPTEIFLPRYLFPNIIYKRGSAGSGVYNIQQYLSFISQFIPSIKAPYPDGVFDEDTETSVIAFQKNFGLKPNGIVEKITWDKIVEIYYNLKLGEEK